MYPLMITAVGLLVCIATSVLGLLGIPRGVNKKEDIEPVLKYQLIISTVLATAALYPLSMTALPHSFHISALSPIGGAGDLTVHPPTVHNWEAYLCVVCGLWCGLVIGLTTEYVFICFQVSDMWPYKRDKQAAETAYECRKNE